MFVNIPSIVYWRTYKHGISLFATTQSAKMILLKGYDILSFRPRYVFSGISKKKSLFPRMEEVSQLETFRGIVLSRLIIVD